MAQELRLALHQLAKRWKERANKAERQQSNPAHDSIARRCLVAEVRAIDLCVADLRSLIEGAAITLQKRRTPT